MKILLSLILCLALLVGSCKKDEPDYVLVKYVAGYCINKGASVVSVESGAEAGSRIALLDVPPSFHVGEKLFLVTYHYDASLDKLDSTFPCPALFGKLKIYVCDSATEPTL